MFAVFISCGPLPVLLYKNLELRELYRYFNNINISGNFEHYANVNLTFVSFE